MSRPASARVVSVLVPTAGLVMRSLTIRWGLIWE